MNPVTDRNRNDRLRQPDIIVSTSADFAVLRGGRPRAAAVWDDVAAMRAYRSPESTDVICIDLTLADGSVVVVQDDFPGWDDFLDVAESYFPGIRLSP